MQLNDILSAQQVAFSSEIPSKKQAFEKLGQLLACGHPDLKADDVFEHLISREKLGSTGVGYGVAIPHARMDQVTTPIAAILRLEHGVDFEAPDNQSVDLLCALVVPTTATNEHLQLLSHLARVFSNEDCRQDLRQRTNARELYEIAVSYGKNSD